MPDPRLDALREKLLRAGIAPRHVRRYLEELRQHFDDLVRAEAASGLPGEAAIRAARARLGSDDALAAAMLARPELRAIGARFPWAVFGIGPMVALGLLIVGAVLLQAGVMKIAHGHSGPVPDWLKSFAAFSDWLMMYVLPPVAVAIFFGLGARQLAKMRWLAVGAFLTAILASAVHCATIFSELPGKSELSVGLGLNSTEASARLAASLIPVCIMSALYWLWQRRQSASTH